MSKVVVFSNMYPSAEHPTYGIFVKNQVEQLKKDGVDIKVIAIQDPGKGKIGKIVKYLSWGIESLLYVLQHKKNISITHAHYAFPTGLVSLLAKKLWKIPYVVTIHGGDLDKMAKKSPRIAKLTHRILQEASEVITVGEKLRNDVIHDYDIAPSKVEVMSMGVDTRIFKPMAQEEVRLLLDVPLNERVVLFVGNVIEAKGIMELIDAFEQLQVTHEDLLLYIVGSQKDQRFTQEVKDKVGNNSGIRFKGPVSQTELAKWMSAADLLALPSYHEGFGLVALEALASGAKVVATNVGGLPYLLKDDVGTLVEPRNAQALAMGLEEALSNEVTREQHEVTQQVIQQHSSTEIVKRLNDIYEQNGKGSSK
ncbi:glycosyl transferase family 1 [Sporosarcina sp. P21c]|uniref:glycosyltransferase n=1 Tax=unclassified Sporosarcina TaxID=2647733 RepID=UPI000C162A78|nr:MULTISPECIES: glycosyltransferase [unclassified Sporosarcina]PIC68138.1 glycosyl transferase family 1 [Sporosarcina sp. P16a]PIC89017.1 glycosyl transferase family 1 [Sporosarcina sp. P21c]PIC94447.1 glycosyl transferase family 1 [Sporosarcina sp. P25]